MNVQDSKIYLYFFLAVMPALVQGDHPPADGWGWFKWGTTALYQGLLAVKAYQSQSEAKPLTT